MTNYEKLLIRLGQACIDWYQDTGDCHLCSVDLEGKHDEDCPVEEAIKMKSVYIINGISTPARVRKGDAT